MQINRFFTLILFFALSGCATPLKSVKNSNIYDGEVTVFREPSIIGSTATLYFQINDTEFVLSPVGTFKTILPVGMHTIKKMKAIDILGKPILDFSGEISFQINKGELVRVGSSFAGEFDFNRYNLDGELINKAPLFGRSQTSKTSLNNIPSVNARMPQSNKSLLSLNITSTSPDSNGVVTLNILTKGETVSLKVNEDELGRRSDGRYSAKRFVQVGINTFEIIATDRFGNIHKQSIEVNREVKESVDTTRELSPNRIPAARPRDAVAIIIGIEKYRRVPNADFANRDASVFYDYARRALGIRPENIRLLIDDKAGAAEILRTLNTWLPTRVKKNTTDIYIFYSGHGLPSEGGEDLYFLPHEVDRDLLQRTAISQKEVVQAIQVTDPKSVTMFIDSCYSGQTRTGTSLLASARPISIAPKALTEFPPNYMVISASAPDQISSSSPELKHGIFSYYLMLGMEGEADGNKDGQITVGEMQTYLSQQVTRRAVGMNRTQSPQTIGDFDRVLLSVPNKSR